MLERFEIHNVTRKRYSFFYSIHPLLKIGRTQMNYISGLKIYLKAIFLGVLAFVLVITSSSALSAFSTSTQMYQSNPPQLAQSSAEDFFRIGREQAEAGNLSEAIESLEQAEALFRSDRKNQQLIITLINLGRLRSEIGQQLYACRVLTEALSLKEKICEEGFSSGNFSDLDEIANHLNRAGWSEQDAEQRNWVEVRGLYVLGNVLRKIGQLDSSEETLSQGLKRTQLLSDISNDFLASVYLSLGNTYKAQGNLARDRQAPSNYEYIPWRYSSKCLPDESGCVPPEIKDKFCVAEAAYEYAYKLVKSSVSDLGDELICQSSTTVKRFSENYYSLQQRLKSDLPSSFIGAGEKARLNQLELLIELEQWEKARELAVELNSIIPVSNDNIVQEGGNQPRMAKRLDYVFSQVSFAKSLAFLIQERQLDKDNFNGFWRNVIKRLETARNEAKISAKAQFKYAESYATGSLGGLYEFFDKEHIGTEYCQSSNEAIDKCWHKAERITQEALYLAQPSTAPDIAYQWQWQLGRLKKNLSEYEESIRWYEASIQTLKSVRSDILTISSDEQFSFRDNVEPVYRELINLRLKPKAGEAQPDLRTLNRVIKEVGELQLAELENFLQCNVRRLTPIEKIADPKAAIIHAVLGKNNLHIILKLPKENNLISYSISVDSQELEKTVEAVFDNLLEEKPYEARQYADKVYKWLVEPIWDDLNNAFPSIVTADDSLDSNPSRGTLVFVMDGVLRKVPLAFLRHSGRYLIQDYSIALAPRQEVFQPQISRTPLYIFAGGVGLKQNDLEGQNFQVIELLEAEFQAIREAGISISEPLLDKDFTVKNIKQKLREDQYSAMHLKTHGQFSSNPNETFIAAYEELIKANEFRSLIQEASQLGGEPLDLLVLSACSGAQGDNRAILGLAGIATLTGARSTIAAMWPAFDEFNTEFMGRFYTELAHSKNTKAEALRKAQLIFKDKGEPATFWANYVLIGNWL